MNGLSIQFEDNLTQFVPGQKIRGRVGWRLDQAPASLDVRLFWYTEGKGTQDISIVTTTTIEHPQIQGSSGFEFQLPQSPYSFSGKLISLIWAIELIARPSNESTRVPFTMSPTGEEISLMTATP
ncbi:MAG TPA: hypothetical protein VL282_17415 [Tepidisphaeraceae bacterium]|jgi:hypothetical protein|nr:hypothetical protein [Tepidisphaeraceae bacterium]